MHYVRPEVCRDCKRKTNDNFKAARLPRGPRRVLVRNIAPSGESWLAATLGLQDTRQVTFNLGKSPSTSGYARPASMQLCGLFVVFTSWLVMLLLVAGPTAVTAAALAEQQAIEGGQTASGSGALGKSQS